MASVQVQRIPTFGSIGRFAGHFAQMCVAMCAGGVVLSLVVFQGATAIANVNLAQRYPELSMLIIGVDSALAMAAFMVLQRHPWRHTLEMSATSIVAAVLIIGAFEFGLVPSKSLVAWYTLFAFQCGPACLLMGVYMAAHFADYSAGGQLHAHPNAG